MHQQHIDFLTFDDVWTGTFELIMCYYFKKKIKILTITKTHHYELESNILYWLLYQLDIFDAYITPTFLSI